MTITYRLIETLQLTH